MSDLRGDNVHELVEDYALGALDPAQRAEFEERLKVDAELRAELRATVETLAALGLSTTATPSPELKDRVLKRIQQVPVLTVERNPLAIPLAAPGRRSRVALWLGAALAASLVLLTKVSLDLRAAQQDTRSDSVMIADRDRTVASRDAVIAQLTDSAVQVVTLAATGPAKPVVRAYMNRVRRTVALTAVALESLPAGQAYQLWFIVDGKPIPSRTFRPDSTGHALLTDVQMPAGAVAATAITREPEGGSPAPTTPILFMAKLATE